METFYPLNYQQKHRKNSANEKTESSNSIVQKFTHPTDGQGSSEDSSHSKNYLDNNNRGAIIPYDTTKQVGCQLLSPNEINVSEQ